MKRVFLMGLLFLLSSCALFKIEVPPESYSLETAIRILENREYTLMDLKNVDQYAEVTMPGKVAVFETKDGVIFFYAYKGEDAKKIWKTIRKKTGFFSVRSILDLPNMGKFSTILEGKKIVAWWKKSWLFIVEGKDGVEDFVKHIHEVYEVLRG
ncbi:DUF3242 domain-containing protein [Thermotoga sp. KOL6]|uniref:DUF3242 domain-containing protein n=1 Tax=Thermotoga sp. KOL6 TaxID=126741 RepID=UPI000C7952F5|nr:DUF3242 domain-containing protein [Thermotoga sp. KOL6]PLV60274.1 hypothetical protein AS005_02995 [Thermotoga sp. KOL6]